MEPVTIEQMEAKLEIDINNLELELMRQSQHLYQASKMYAGAIDRRDTTKHDLKALAASLAGQFRQVTDKPTEAKISEHVDSHPAYNDLYSKHLQFKAEADVWSGLVDAFAERCQAIRSLVQLHCTGYYGSGVANGMQRAEYIESKKSKKGTE